jgi:hypothetical protein
MIEMSNFSPNSQTFSLLKLTHPALLLLLIIIIILDSQVSQEWLGQ